MAADISLVERIYEAAVIPERWAAICDDLAAGVDGFSATIVTIGNDQSFRWVCSPHAQEQMELFSQNPLRFENPRPKLHLQLEPSSFARDLDLMTVEELAVDPIYNEILRPLGLGYTMGSQFLEPSGHTIIFDLIRETSKGPYGLEDVARMNALRPDLARAALMSSRLAFQQAQTVTQTLSTLGLPSAVIGDDGSVIAMNPEMEAMSPRIRAGAGNRISLKEPPANGLLQDSLQQVRSGFAPRLQSIPMPADPHSPALILHLLPVKREARDIFSRSAAILIATPIGEVGPPDLRVISGLFDLTAAEARVAREIAVGISVDETGRKLSVTRETVRTHLKSIFSKTGTAKQSQLVMLLSGLGAMSP